VIQRAEHLEQNEDAADQGERASETASVLDCANQDAHGDGKYGGKNAAPDEREPPRNCEAAVRLRQDTEESPFVPLAETAKHLFCHACRKHDAAAALRFASWS